MDDLISRKAAIEVAESHRVERPGFHLNDYEFGVTEAADAIASDLEDLPLVQQWIPCCERLPEESGKYIVTAFDGHKNRVAYVQYIRKIIGWWALSGQRTYWKVIAWMPFPEPYTKEKA